MASHLESQLLSEEYKTPSSYNVAVVDKKYCQKFRSLLHSLDCFDGTRSIEQVDCHSVALPITNSAILQNIAYKDTDHLMLNDINFIINSAELRPAKKDSISFPYKTLLNRISTYAASYNLEMSPTDIPKRWEKHGDMVLLPHNSFLHSEWNKLGTGLWQQVALALRVKRVGRKSKILSNCWRSPRVELLLGDNGWVEHLENGIRYCYDVTKCMFSAGNVSEKLRVASFKCQGETVVDMFAGIGYFTLPFLVHAGAALVHACEWSPMAADALHKTLQANGVAERCIIHFGDNKEVAPVGVADRVNLGLIPSSEASWFSGCRALRGDQGGILHIHGNVTSMSDHNVAWQKWSQSTVINISNHLYNLYGSHWTVHTLHLQHVKSYAPHIHHLVLDVQCKPPKS